MYIKCYAEPVDKYQRNYKIHLWDDEEGYIEEKYRRTAFTVCQEQEAEYLGLNGEYLKETPQFKMNSTVSTVYTASTYIYIAHVNRRIFDAWNFDASNFAVPV